MLAVCTVSLAAAPAFRLDSGSVLAQEATPGPEEYIEPTPPSETAPPITEEAPVEATLASTEEAAPEAPIVPSEEIELADSAPVAEETETASEDAPAPVPIMTVNDQPGVDCWLPAGVQIDHGGSLDYECKAHLDLSAEQLPVVETRIRWTVTADVSGDWAVRLAPMDTDPTWTLSEAVPAVLELSTPLHSEAGPANWETNESVQFRLRVHRARCDVASQTVQLRTEVSFSPEGTEGIELRLPETDAEPVRIAPELAPIPVPSASFDGTIAFEPVEVSAVDDTRATGIARVLLTGLDAACGDWVLLLEASSGSPEVSLWLTTVNGVPLSDACALATECQVDRISANAGSPTESAYVLDVLVTIPSGVLPGTLRALFDIALVAA